MNPPKKRQSELKPCLVREFLDGHWMAWDEQGELILQAKASFELLSIHLYNLGFTQVSPNSAVAMDIRNRWRKEFE